MRVIPVAIKTLLKSRSIIGANAPNAVVTFTDVVGGYSEPTWESVKKTRYDASDNYGIGNWINRTDGTILATYFNYTDRAICLSTVVNEQYIIDNENCWAENESVFISLNATSQVSTGRQLACRSWLFRTTAGVLQLYVYEPGTLNGTTAVFYIKVYTSATGNGDDFTLLSTVDTNVSAASSGTFNKDIMDFGGVIELASGRLICHYGKPIKGTGGFSGYYIIAYHCAYSDDQGATWTTKLIYTYNSGNGYQPTIGSIGKAGGNRIMVLCKTYHAADWTPRVIYYSDDEGATWSVTGEYVGTNDTLGLGPRAIFSPGDGYTYLLWCTKISNPSNKLYRRSESTVFDTANPFTIGAGNTWPDELLNETGQDGYNQVFMGEYNIILSSRNAGASPDEWAVYIGVRTYTESTLGCSSVRLSREISANSQRCQVSLPNVNPTDLSKIGYYAPESDNVDVKWVNIMKPGCNLNIEIGYGTEFVQIFKGQVDDTNVTDDAGSCEIELDCRDDGWMINDKAIMDGTKYYMTYVGRTVEYIVDDLLTKAGFTDITTEVTGITITEKTFDRMTYSEALEWCLTVSGFELIIDDYGAANFHQPTDRQPTSEGTHVLIGTTPSPLDYYPVVTSSIIVMNALKTVTYSATTDYLVVEGDDSTAWTIERIVGTTIGDGDTVWISYVYAAYVYREGEDIFNLTYKYSRRDMYAKIIVTGKTNAPLISDETHVLNNSTYVALTNYPIDTNTIEVWSGAGKTGTQYTRSGDYDVLVGDKTTAWRIKRQPVTAIPNGGTVYVTYNESTDVTCSGEYAVATPASYGITADKVLFVDDSELDTDAKCQSCADQLGADMVKKYRECTFVAVGVPWLQVGDCIQVIETSSGISEVYRILSLDVDLDESGMYMTLRTYHYGWAPF